MCDGACDCGWRIEKIISSLILVYFFVTLNVKKNDAVQRFHSGV